MLVDRLNQPLAVGDRVAYASYKNLGLTLGTIVKIGRVRATVEPEAPAFNPAAESFRTNELVKV